MEITEGEQDQLMLTCMSVFEAEYQEVWPVLFEELESWIEQNDQMLEETKPQS